MIITHAKKLLQLLRREYGRYFVATNAHALTLPLMTMRNGKIVLTRPDYYDDERARIPEILGACSSQTVNKRWYSRTKEAFLERSKSLQERTDL